MILNDSQNGPEQFKYSLRDLESDPMLKPPPSIFEFEFL